MYFCSFARHEAGQKGYELWHHSVGSLTIYTMFFYRQQIQWEGLLGEFSINWGGIHLVIRKLNCSLRKKDFLSTIHHLQTIHT